MSGFTRSLAADHPLTRFVTDTQSTATGTRPLQLIAAGLWRCSTSSLQAAFESTTLDLSPSMHGAYLMPHVSRLKIVCEAARETDRTRRQKLLRNLFDGYPASSDYPGFAFLDDLLEMYPDVQVILNKRRSATEWKRSVDSSLAFYASKTYLILTWLIPQSYWHHQLYVTYTDMMERRFGRRDIFSQGFYDTHNDWVKEICQKSGKGNPTEWVASHGWTPLCKALKVKPPSGDVAFPRINDGQAMRELKRYLILRGLAAWGALLLLASFTAVGVWWCVV